MEVFKFGGASVKDANSVRNVGKIIGSKSNLVIVISAMGKTTNTLENLINAFTSNEKHEEFVEITKRFHTKIIDEIFPQPDHAIRPTFETIFNYLNRYLESSENNDYDQVYDQIVPIGELLSSKILSAYLTDLGIENKWLDIRKILRTDNYFRKANVDLEVSKMNLQQAIESGIYVTQGFIGGTENNLMTTLGREGSDYTAALISNMLNAKSLTVWKDVPGVLNADPRYFNDPKKLDQISYREAIELSFYGASIIHPKTIKPLQNLNIPLYVKSFVSPDSPGSVINENTDNDDLLPIYIYKPNQLLISLSRKDYGFLQEEQLSEVFRILHEHKLEVNIMQNSAINFSICLDNIKNRIEKVLPIFQENYRVLYNTNLELLTIRHYQDSGAEELIKGHEVILEQKTRNTVKFLLRSLN